MGLGAYPDKGIAAARREAAEARQLIADGVDPISARAAQQSAAKAETVEVVTFEIAARRVHGELKPSWKNAKHQSQWINTLSTYVFPMIGDRRVDELKPADFAAALKPIWLSKAETASRVKQRCHAVMKWCWGQELVQGNPVDMVDTLLPKQKSARSRVVHHPAMPWRDIPEFVAGVVMNGEDVTRRLLEFVILTAARSGEARSMTWAEVDLEKGVWTVPADRMKADVAHRVPLSDRAIEILESQRDEAKPSDLVFPSPRGKVLTDMALTEFLRHHKVKSDTPGRVATAHGFRSAFRDWASETSYPRDLAERALAHTIRDQSEAAYHRTDLLELRRPMMEAWAQHVGSLVEN
ncbi:MAG: site-specific integrase [Paracoccaceae bacterium]